MAEIQKIKFIDLCTGERFAHSLSSFPGRGSPPIFIKTSDQTAIFAECEDYSNAPHLTVGNDSVMEIIPIDRKPE